MDYIKFDESKDRLRNKTGNIVGERPGPSKKKAVARCTNHIHVMDMSASVIRKHNCLNVRGGICPWMQMYEHEYWAQRERLKAKKKKVCA